MPLAEVIVEEKLLPRSVLRESNVGKQFPHFRFAGENSGDCWPARHPAQLPPTQPHATSYTHVPHHCSSHSCKHHVLSKSTSLGLSFCPVTGSKPKLLHLANQTPWCKPLQHMASTALGVTVQTRETLLTSLMSQSPVLLKPQASSSISATHWD